MTSALADKTRWLTDRLIHPLRSYTVRSLVLAVSRRLLALGATLERRAQHARFIEQAGASIQWIRCVEPRHQSLEDRWRDLARSETRTTIVAVTYKRPAALLAFLHSLNCQTRVDFKLHVLHDGEHAESRAVLDAFRETCRFPLEVTFTEKRHDDWGHSLRQIGLDRVDTEFVLLTNADNYYVPRFAEFAFEAIQTHGLDLLHWDMVHSHDYAGGSSNRTYSALKTVPELGSIDIGAFMVRTAVARSVGFRHRSFDADGLFLVDLLQSGRITRVGHLEKILFVHN